MYVNSCNFFKIEHLKHYKKMSEETKELKDFIFELIKDHDKSLTKIPKCLLNSKEFLKLVFKRGLDRMCKSESFSSYSMFEVIGCFSDELLSDKEFILELSEIESDHKY
jgi:hypothetical protein